MKKQIKFKIHGHRENVGNTTIYRLLPNQYTHHVGHFVFLDYIPPFMIREKQLNQNFAHPHRGIATLTYILNGEAEHFDSRGHKGMVHSGGVQWMKAGNGIVHNESMGPDTKTEGKLLHGFQFWINLPAKQKKENPEYMALQAEELPLLQLDDNAGTLKVVVGEYGGQSSKIPTYAKQFLYHVRLNAGKQITLPTVAGQEYAIFLPQHDLTINNESFFTGDLIGFSEEGSFIEISNNLNIETDFILFGGEKYTEPFVAQGPFVMSTEEEIRDAYYDAKKGKYGKIVYS